MKQSHVGRALGRMTSAKGRCKNPINVRIKGQMSQTIRICEKCGRVGV